MRVLRVFDVSAFIHAGMVNKHSYLLPALVEDLDGYKESRIETGGVSLLWNILYEEFGKCDLVFCFDSRPFIKEGMLPGYKAGREHNIEVSKCVDVCRFILDDCDFTTLKEDGYEADDLIHSVVQNNKNSYDHVYIYCNDSDMYYLVDENVTILPPSSRAKTVTIDNYTYTVRKDKYTPYNALTFYKILFGDKSDNIPGLNPSLVARLRSAYDNKTCYKYMGRKEDMLSMFRLFGDEALAQCSLVFPLDVNTPTEFSQGDKMNVALWGDAMRNKLWRTGGRVPERIQACIEQMASMGLTSST